MSGSIASANAAETALRGCFERVYDKSHLAAHKGQMVKAIQLQIGLADLAGGASGEEDQDFIALKFAAKPGLYFGGGSCMARGAEASCTNKENAERFAVSTTRNGIKLVFESPMAFYIEGSFETKVVVPRDAENQTYALIKVSGGHCLSFNNR